jgi:CBS domain containing-hemolysin-like protein
MIPLILFLLAILAVYVGVIETAFSALMRLSLRLMVERGGRDDRLGFYLEDPIRLFLPARLLLGLIFSFATMCIALLTGRTGSLRAISMLLLFVAVFILVCEHVLPIFIVRRNPERMLEVLLPPFDALARAVRPLTNSLTRLIKEPRRDRAEETAVATEAPGGEPPEQPPATEDEQRLTEVEGRKLLQSIVDFGDTLVREVMTPRPDMVAIAADATLADVRALFREQEYSRVPVFGENLDHILGIVYVKDLIQLREVSETAQLQRDLPQLLRPAMFVPETNRVADLLKEFQSNRSQMAIVLDEYGGTAGLVTIEDLLEEIVGEIRDEYDVEVEPVIEQADGSFVFSGKVNFDEVRDRLDVEVEPEGFETVGGYVMTRVGRVPAVGERFDLDGMEVEVLEAERRRIHRVRFKRVAAAEAPQR